MGEDVSRGDGTLEFFSASSEGRECVEIARRCLQLAGEGVPFDRMAVVLRTPGLYRPHLLEALRRAQIPARFSRGTVLPDPSGRALLALLDCRAESYSARAFAEYLSLGVIPSTDDGAPPPATDAFVLPDLDVIPFEEALVLRPRDEGAADVEGLERADFAGSLRVPRYWESLLVDAAVIGGIDRWERRLDVLDANLARARAGLDPDDPQVVHLQRRADELQKLRGFALPLLRALAALPTSAPWILWLDALRELATRALREPERVLQVLAELAPLGPVGPVGIGEVRAVLDRRLVNLVLRPPANAPGVRIWTTDEARGLDADVVFLPGLAEKLFPEKVVEDPLLLDARRAQLPEPLRAWLAVASTRVAEERAHLAVAVGAATQRLVVSWPRVDSGRARPRVPSFYALELARQGARLGTELARQGARLGTELARQGARSETELAREGARSETELAPQGARLGGAPGGPSPEGEGRSPSETEPPSESADGDGDLTHRALARAAARALDEETGWPAPDDPRNAIDDAEFDLAALRRLMRRPVQGAAGYLLEVHPHLARALSARARRWGTRSWTRHDGLVDDTKRPDVRSLFERYSTRAKPYSATALQRIAACPYQFALYSMLKLSPREVPEPIEEPNPMQRGTFVHDAQFDLLSELRDRKLLPLDHPQKLAAARQVLDEILPRVAAEHAEELVPAIPRVWDDFVAGIRLDLHEWLGRLHDDAEWVPSHFELSFGVERGTRRDPASRPETVTLPLDVPLALRGSIDLVEARGDQLRATDHKSGKAREKGSVRIAGGRALQPVLYALALEALYPGREVVGGQLSYCTSRGKFDKTFVPLDDEARRLAGDVVRTLDVLLERGFFPAAPDERACDFCDYQPICGPGEARRVRRKDPRFLGPLVRLRSSR
ncbi:MAG: PD-(D/E)XK nuclease family protein [Myxococcales bacterium]|nr:PD-(D/E)XK nuclease family protein [Myxococcales bacterium]